MVDAEWIESFTPKDSYVVASMPEIVVEAGRKTYPQLVMGKFSSTKDMGANEANKLNLLTFEQLLALLEKEEVSAVALSNSATWNFNWSIPTLRLISKDDVDAINNILNKNYKRVHFGNVFIILIKKQYIH